MVWLSFLSSFYFFYIWSFCPFFFFFPPSFPDFFWTNRIVFIFILSRYGLLFYLSIFFKWKSGVILYSCVCVCNLLQATFKYYTTSCIVRDPWKGIHLLPFSLLLWYLCHIFYLYRSTNLTINCYFALSSQLLFKSFLSEEKPHIYFYMYSFQHSSLIFLNPNYYLL